MNAKQARNSVAAAQTADEPRDIDAKVTAAQIGRMNLLAISGGRAMAFENALVLPVAAGYHVVISLSVFDTYTVRRVFTRNGRAFVKAEWTDIYCEEIGEVAYRASCYLDEVPA
ncbi:MAG TPA: hypothetical protein VIG24_00315 [Acidimicrobiia bacterium]